MPYESRVSSRRGCSGAALILLSLTSVSVAQDPAPTTSATSRPTRDAPPPLASLDAIRLDRRMTLLNVGEALEPFAKLADDATPIVVEHPSHRELILDLARRQGRPAPTVRVLPEESRTSDRYGIVTADHAILRKGTDDLPGDRENLSDVTLGEPVWILDADEARASLLIHASDGYVGWVDAAAVWPVEAKLFHDWLGRWSRQAMEAFDAQFSPGTQGIGALAKARDAAALVKRWDEAVASQASAHGGPPRSDVVRDRAFTFLSTRYVWGGKTTDGIDCSGLAQAALASVGVKLPRDADQQSLVGRLVATRWDTSGLRPGDLLFYLSPRRGGVHHVALYLGDGEYIEAAGPDVHVSSMKPDAPNYDAKRAATFAWARRVID